MARGLWHFLPKRRRPNLSLAGLCKASSSSESYDWSPPSSASLLDGHDNNDIYRLRDGKLENHQSRSSCSRSSPLNLLNKTQIHKPKADVIPDPAAAARDSREHLIPISRSTCRISDSPQRTLPPRTVYLTTGQTRAEVARRQNLQEILSRKESPDSDIMCNGKSEDLLNPTSATFA